MTTPATTAPHLTTTTTAPGQLFGGLNRAMHHAPAHIPHGRLAISVFFAAALLIGVVGTRMHKRHQLVENVLGTIASSLGWRSPDYDAFSWQQSTRPGQKPRKRPRPVNLCPLLYAGGRPLQWRHGQLERLVARYRPTHVAFDQDKQDKIAKVLCAILEGPVTVEWNHNKRLIFITRIRAAEETDVHTFRQLQGIFDRALDNPSVTVTGHAEDRISAFDVTYRPTNKDATGEFRASVDNTVNAKTDREWQSQWDPTNHRVRYRLREQLPERILHPLQPVTSDHLGFADSATCTLYWNLGDTPHALVVGRSGRGKSVIIRGLLFEACRPERNIDVRIVDPKKLSLLALRGWPGITHFAVTNEDMAQTIHDVYQIVESRNTAILDGKATREQYAKSRILLAVDETWELIRKLKKTDYAYAIEELMAIARTGRETGVHVLAGMQRPDASMLSGEGRSNFGLRIALGSLDAEGRRMVAAEGLVATKVRGRCEVIEEGEPSTLAQGWWTPDPSERMSAEEKACVDALRPSVQKVPQGPSVQTNVTASTFVADDGMDTPPCPQPAGRVVSAEDRAVDGLPPRLSDEKIRRIYELADAEPKVSVRQIALQVGVSKSAVAKYVAEHRAKASSASGRPVLRVVGNDED